jgi:hypothetical protein
MNFKIEIDNLYKTSDNYIVKIDRRIPTGSIKMYEATVYVWLNYSEKYLTNKQLYSESGRIIEDYEHKDNYTIIEKLNKEDYPEFFI